MKSKELVGVLCAVSIAVSLVGCGSGVEETTSPVDWSEKPTTGTVATEVPVTTVSVVSETPVTTTAQTEATQETKFVPPEDPALKAELEAAGITDVVNGWETDINNPVKIGQWARISAISGETNENEEVFVRIVSTGDLDKDQLEEYNMMKYDDRDRVLLSEELKDIAEFRSFTYEIYYPKSFHMSKYGVGGLRSFNLVNANSKNKDFKYNDKRVEDMLISVKSFDYDTFYFPGDTASTDGVYALLKGDTESKPVFKTTFIIAGSSDDSYHTCYFATE